MDHEQARLVAHPILFVFCGGESGSMETERRGKERWRKRDGRRAVHSVV